MKHTSGVKGAWALELSNYMDDAVVDEAPSRKI